MSRSSEALVKRRAAAPAPGSAARRPMAPMTGIGLEARLRTGSEMITRSPAAASIRSSTACASARKW